MRHEIIISLASNERQAEHLEAARKALSQTLGELYLSRELWTDPIGTANPSKYLNQLAKAATELSAVALNARFKEIEQSIGRERNNGGRVAIDIDLLQYDLQRYHERDWERDYVKLLIDEL